jgi:hypothetical protein
VARQLFEAVERAERIMVIVKNGDLHHAPLNRKQNSLMPSPLLCAREAAAMGLLSFRAIEKSIAAETNEGFHPLTRSRWQFLLHRNFFIFCFPYPTLGPRRI